MRFESCESHKACQLENGDRCVITEIYLCLVLVEDYHSKWVNPKFEEDHSLVTNLKWSPSAKKQETKQTRVAIRVTITHAVTKQLHEPGEIYSRRDSSHAFSTFSQHIHLLIKR